MTMEVLNPTHEAQSAKLELAPRPVTLEGATVGFISNGKEGTIGFFASWWFVWKIFAGTVVGAVLVAFFAAPLLKEFSSDQLRKIFAVVMILMGVQMLFQK